MLMFTGTPFAFARFGAKSKRVPALSAVGLILFEDSFALQYYRELNRWKFESEK